MPSAIVIVEGESDVTFMNKLAQLHIPDRKVAFVRSEGDGGIMSRLNVLKEAFGDLTASPYRDRLFVVLDQRHSQSAIRIETQGVPKQNLTVWEKNGIEYLYPPALVAGVFRCDVQELANANLETDPIEFNGFRKKKKELAQLVCDGMTVAHSLSAELQALLGRLRAACQ